MNEIELGKQLGFNVHCIGCWNNPRLEMPGFKKDFSFLFLFKKQKVKKKKKKQALERYVRGKCDWNKYLSTKFNTGNVWSFQGSLERVVPLHSHQRLLLLALWFKLNGSYTMGNQYFVVPNSAFTLGAQYSCNSVGRFFWKGVENDQKNVETDQNESPPSTVLSFQVKVKN